MVLLQIFFMFCHGIAAGYNPPSWMGVLWVLLITVTAISEYTLIMEIVK